MASVNEIEKMGVELFECLMNRIFNVSEFDRFGQVTTRERDIMDRWLSRNEGEDERPVF